MFSLNFSYNVEIKDPAMPVAKMCSLAEYGGACVTLSTCDVELGQS